MHACTHAHTHAPGHPTSGQPQQRRGQRVLSEYGLQQYEVSAYARQGQESRHNLNYWQFGDYLALGAGAHGKISLADSGKIVRYNKTRLPAHYLERNASRTAQSSAIATSELAFEFLLNALRLNAGFSKKLFEIRTGQSLASIEAPLQAAIDEALIERSGESLRLIIGAARRRVNERRSVIRMSTETFFAQLQAEDPGLKILLREGKVGPDLLREAVERQLRFFEQELQDELVRLAAAHGAAVHEPASAARAITRLVFTMGALALDRGVEDYPDLIRQTTEMVRMIVTGSQAMASLQATADSA